MTQLEIVKAYEALQRLTDLSLPLAKARAIYSMVKKADEHFQFAVKEEGKYVTEFNGTLAEDGNVSFATADDMKGFSKKVEALNKSEVEWDIPPVTLTEKDLGSQIITPKDIAALEGFVNFEA